MADIKLNRLLKKELSSFVANLLKAIQQGFSVYDAQNQVLLGEDHPSLPRHPILVADEVVGWVAGDDALAIAQLFTTLINQVVEKKALANEVLDKYREINLLYNIAEKLTSCRELSEVVRVALEEAQRLIQATSADLLLLKNNTQTLQSLNPLDTTSLSPIPIQWGKGIVGSIAAAGKPELVNQVAMDPRHDDPDSPIQSLLCAPIKAKDRVIGVLVIYCTTLMNYTAADLKLLAAIAAQTTPAIESALFYQQQMEAAQAREARLKEELLELKIEIDQVKRSRQVAEITETEYFQRLQQQAKLYRKKAQQHWLSDSD